MGRYGHLGFFKRPTPQDHALVKEALESVGMLDLAQRPIGELSGGQQQRVFIARALAQQPNIFILDEPFNGVDAATEKVIMHILHAQVACGNTVIAVHHNMHTCKAYFNELIYIDRTLKAHGSVDDVLRAVQQNFFGL